MDPMVGQIIHFGVGVVGEVLVFATNLATVDKTYLYARVNSLSPPTGLFAS